jgi:hypothetical protein
MTVTNAILERPHLEIMVFQKSRCYVLITYGLWTFNGYIYVGIIFLCVFFVSKIICLSMLLSLFHCVYFLICSVLFLLFFSIYVSLFYIYFFRCVLYLAIYPSVFIVGISSHPSVSLTVEFFPFIISCHVSLLFPSFFLYFSLSFLRVAFQERSIERGNCLLTNRQ